MASIASRNCRTTGTEGPSGAAGPRGDARGGMVYRIRQSRNGSRRDQRRLVSKFRQWRLLGTGWIKPDAAR